MIETIVTPATGKEIRYNRVGHDYDALLNGQYIGSFPTYLAAATELDNLASDFARQTAIDTADNEADAAEPVATDAPPLAQPVTIDLPGITYHVIPIHAESKATLTEEMGISQLVTALVVDGRSYGLCFTKHTVGRPELVQTCEDALATVEQAIAELAAPRWQLCSSCGDMVSQAPICAACVESGEPVIAPELLAEADAVLLDDHLRSFNAAYCLAAGIITSEQLAMWGS